MPLNTTTNNTETHYINHTVFQLNKAMWSTQTLVLHKL